MTALRVISLGECGHLKGAMTKLRVLDLFSGIGGFSLGLERTGGFETVAFCEIEPFPRKVLAKHWPGVPIYDDVRTLTAERLAADGIAVDVICGGFPCQDISIAGKGAGLAGERSGLWSEIARLAGELRPRFVIVENVSALLRRGLDVVLGDLAALGFNAEWHCIPASAIGAPHKRDRLWMVAHCFSEPIRQQSIGIGWGGYTPLAGYDGEAEDVADADGGRQQGLGLAQHAEQQGSCGREFDGLRSPRRRSGAVMGDAAFPRLEIKCRGEQEEFSPAVRASHWSFEPDVGRVAYGIPDRVDRLKGLGNAVVPQIPEMIGRAILASMGESP